MPEFGKSWKQYGKHWKFYYNTNTERVLFLKERRGWYSTEFTQTKRRGKWSPRMR